MSLRYKEMFGKELKDAVDAEVGNGDFGKALVNLCYPPDKLDAVLVRYCVEGIGARERILYPVLCGRSNEEMDRLKQAYFEVHGEDIGVVLNRELKGDFEKFIFYCLQGLEQDYDPDYHTDEKAALDAEAFYEAGQGNWLGSDETSFFELICKAPPEHLQRINEIYSEKHGVSIVKALDKEMGGDVEKATRFAAGMKLLPYETIAMLIKEACGGIGTNEDLLIIALIRYAPIMKQVNEAHEKLYGKSVSERLKDEARGEYERLLLAIASSAE